MSFESKVATMAAGTLIWFALWIAVVVGWVMNIVDLFYQSFEPLTAVAVLRVVGIFILPLGAVMGFFW